MKFFTVANNHVIAGATFLTEWINGECFIGRFEFGKLAVSNELLLNREDALLSPSLHEKIIRPQLTIMQASVSVNYTPGGHNVLVPQISESSDALIWTSTGYRFNIENELMPGLMRLTKGHQETVEVLDLGYFHGYRRVASYRLYFDGEQVHLNDESMYRPLIWA